VEGARCSSAPILGASELRSASVETIKLSNMAHVIAAAVVADPRSWALGWEAIVALGTLALALATVVLAWKTKMLADESVQDRASQSRPVLVPGVADPATPPVEVRGSLVLRVRNAGRGPALDVQALAATRAPQPWDSGAVSPDTESVLEFTDVGDFADSLSVTLDYKDLADRQFRSTIVVRRVPDRPASPPRYRVADVVIQDASEINSPGVARARELEGLRAYLRSPRRAWRARNRRNLLNMGDAGSERKLPDKAPVLEWYRARRGGDRS